MKIVSGRTGTPHVTSQQFRQILEGTVGQGSYIFKSGENLEPELVSNNLLKIRSGMMCHHGNVSCIEIGTYDEVELPNGSQGMKRIDLIVNRYTRNEGTGVESNNWVVIQGTPVASDPAVPSYTVGNLQEGDLADDCPVIQVSYDGLNVTKVKKLLSVVKNTSEMEVELAKLNSKTEILNKTDQTPGSALKYRDATELGYTNLTFGYWAKGIYLYPGYLDGAPNDYAGLLLVFTNGTSFMKYAFTFEGTIYAMRQKISDGTITLGWTKI